MSDQIGLKEVRIREVSLNERSLGEIFEILHVLKKSMEERHKSDCIQVVHSKAHKCNCGLPKIIKILKLLSGEEK